MTLDLYFARRFLRSFLAVGGAFFLLLALIDLVELLRKLTDTSTSLAQVAGLIVLNAPKGLNQILPLIMILATVGLFIGMARSSELVVARAAGRSALRSLMPTMVVAAVIGVLATILLNPIVAATSKRYNALYEYYRTGSVESFSFSSEGLWLRQSGHDGEGQTVIRAARANPEGTQLYDVTMLTYAPGAGPVRRIEADTAELGSGGWLLRGAKVWQLEGVVNPEANAEVLPQLNIASSLTEDSIRDSFAQPDVISVWELPAYIRDLEAAGFSGRRHEVWLQRELARPLFLVAVVLASAAFTMRHARGGRTGVSVLSAVMLGFTLYYIRNFAQILGESGQIPVMLAAWAPPVASFLLALGLLLYKEDG